MRLLPPTLWALIAMQIDALSPPLPPQAPLLPTVIRKMPPDQGAKFHHSYCAFAPHQTSPLDPSNSAPLQPARQALNAFDAHRRRDMQEGNSSVVSLPDQNYLYNPPFAVTHEESEGNVFRRAAEVLFQLQRRQWACPTGTSGCDAIGYPNSCCRDGEKCVEVQDTGLGPVGCCPVGATCAGGVTGCTDGSTPCASEIGGGCCIPGFVCQGVGCVKSASATTTAVTTTAAPPPAGATTFTTTSTSVIQAPTPSTVLVTVVVTISASEAPPTTRTLTQTVSVSGSSSSQQQPATTTSSGDGIGAPFRPTSSSTNSIGTFCPTGFYACLASAGGGCCQTGRDCQTTSCPPVSMTTIINDNGITVVVPAAGATAVSTGACASGWYMCGSDAGPIAGCCPSGYSCGTASCSVLADGATATIAKALPGRGAKKLALDVGLMKWVLGLAGVFMIVA